MSFSDRREGERDFERRGEWGYNRERYREDPDYRHGVECAREEAREQEEREERARIRHEQERAEAKQRDMEAEQRYYHQTQQDQEEEPFPSHEPEPVAEEIQKAREQFVEDNLGAG